MIGNWTWMLAAAESTPQDSPLITGCKIAGLLFIVLGLILFVGGAVGLVRFPDFYSRMHAAGKGDTLSTLFLIGGFCLYHVGDVVHAMGHGDWYKPVFVILKLIGISFFIMLTSPTCTHALMEAGYEDGIDPQVVQDELKETQQQSS